MHGRVAVDAAGQLRLAARRDDRDLGRLRLDAVVRERPGVAARREARLARNFAEADRIRKDLESRGVILEDTGATTRWKKK